MARYKSARRLHTIMAEHDLGASRESGTPIGNAYDDACDALYGAEIDDLTDVEAERLRRDLDDLDACYDSETGYSINEPLAHKRTWEVVDTLEKIVLRAVASKRDADD